MRGIAHRMESCIMKARRACFIAQKGKEEALPYLKALLKLVILMKNMTHICRSMTAKN